MKKLILSKFQKRFLIIYLFINIIALTVNYFGFNLKYTYGSYEVPPNSVNSWWVNRIFYIFTNSDGTPQFIYDENKNNLYPFVDFYTSDDRGLEHTFVGMFAYYDTTEFFVYLIPLLIFIVYKKFW